MEKINLNNKKLENTYKNIFDKIFLSVKNKVASVVFASTLFLSPVNASDNLETNYHDFLYWIENELKNIWLLDKDQKYRAQLYLLFDEKVKPKYGFKFRSDNDLFKWEFSKNSTWVWFIDKNDIYNTENIEAFLKYWVSYFEKNGSDKINYWISAWVNLSEYDTKIEAWIFKNKLWDFEKDKKVRYAEIVKNLNPENYSKIRLSAAVSNYDWENYVNWWVRTFLSDNWAVEWEYDSSKTNRWTILWFQIFVKFYKSWPEVHTKVHYKNWAYTWRVINQWNVINQPDDTRLFFENNVLWF